MTDAADLKLETFVASLKLEATALELETEPAALDLETEANVPQETLKQERSMLKLLLLG
jgi:hypothetical protein